MKRCPKCNRTFPDENQKFCTVDGGLLIGTPAFDPNATMRATSADLGVHTSDVPRDNAATRSEFRQYSRGIQSPQALQHQQICRRPARNGKRPRQSPPRLRSL